MAIDALQQPPMGPQRDQHNRMQWWCERHAQRTNTIACNVGVNSMRRGTCPRNVEAWAAS